MKIIRGKVKKPLTTLLFGVEGIGKTTWASKAPSPISLGAEENDEFDTPRFPKCKSWNDVLNGLDYLLKEKHDFKTLILDTLDSIETLLHKHIIDNDPNDSMATACRGYGQAYKRAAEMLISLRDDRLCKLRDEKGMNIVLLAHATKVKFEDPVHNMTYDTYEMKLHERARPVFKDWVSCIFFANYEIFKTEDNKGNESAIGEGSRKMFTEKRPGHDGKNRFGFPYEMELEWDEFFKLVEDYYGNSASQSKTLLKTIREFYPKIKDDDLLKKVKASVKKAKSNTKELNKILNRLEEVTK